MKVILTLVLVLMCGNAANAIKDKWPDKSLFHLNEVWKNEENSDFLLKQLSGKPTLLIMAYTSCQHTCPIIISKTLDIWKSVPKAKRQQVQLVLVSFDPKRDTPQNLKKYKAKRKLSSHWTFLSGKDSKVRKLAAILGINYKADDQGEFSHSNVISLLDKDGVVVSQITDLGMPNETLIKKLLNLLK